MLEYLTGKVISCSGGLLVLDVNGIGFGLKVPLTTEMKFKRGENCKVFAHLVIRDDSVKLFGFGLEEERELFHKLQGVSGVGPAMAIAILSGGGPSELRAAILTENLNFFKNIKGVGPKTAKRIILELKGSIKNIQIVSTDPKNTAINEAMSALIALGYPQNQASEAIEKSIKQMGDKATTEELVRESLREFG